MFAWFYYCASVSRDFFLLMKLATESACHGILRLCLYTNEVVLRNRLCRDMGGKYQAVYFQIMDLPDWIRARAPLRWFTCGYVFVAHMDDADVGVGQLM